MYSLELASYSALLPEASEESKRLELQKEYCSRLDLLANGAEENSFSFFSTLDGNGFQIVPVSRTRRCNKPAGRKDSSLQERIFVPTSSELVARIRALSSLRLTPAMDATSLMSSSSLMERGRGADRCWWTGIRFKCQTFHNFTCR